ncbi:hypothetical protein Dimus_030811, partial [Dionaea muscipula]
MHFPFFSLQQTTGKINSFNTFPLTKRNPSVSNQSSPTCCNTNNGAIHCILSLLCALLYRLHLSLQRHSSLLLVLAQIGSYRTNEFDFFFLLLFFCTLFEFRSRADQIWK